MSSTKKGTNNNMHEGEMELRRGPWTLEEDTLLIHYIACHGEGRWNLLAKCSDLSYAGLKRTGKSCRLRWLNYLKPDVKRGNLTPEEQILILDLHSKWGNRWSRIAQHLPGRTDNEIKNYWRTRVQKQARQLKIDANSTLFRDALRCFWMPRLIEKMGCSSRQVLPFQSPNPIANGDNNIPIKPPNPPTIIPNPTTTNQFQFQSCSSSTLSADALKIIAQLNGRPRDEHQVSGLMGGIMDGDDRQFMMRNELNEVIYGLGCRLDYDSLPVVEPTAGDFGSRSVSDCSVMENYWIDHHNNMDDSLWSIWMNFSNS